MNAQVSGVGSATGTASGAGTRASAAFSCGCRARDGSYFPSLLEPRRRAERALVSVVQEAYVQGAEANTEASVSAGEMLVDMASYWREALPDERRDIVWAILKAGGLIYDLERRLIVGVLPRPEMFLVFSIGLTPDWEQREGGLWRRDLDRFPKREYVRPLPPPTPRALTPEQREEALALVKSGLSLRKVAARFAGVSYGAIWRLLHSHTGDVDSTARKSDNEP